MARRKDLLDLELRLNPQRQLRLQRHLNLQRPECLLNPQHLQHPLARMAPLARSDHWFQQPLQHRLVQKVRRKDQ